jgi:DNA-binding NarL/FixJ family response regulator
MVGRHDSIDEIIQAITSVASGQKYVSNSLTNDIVSLLRSGVEASERLTRRELEVAGMAAANRPTASICRDLGLRPATLKSHLRSIFRKLGVHHRSEIVAFVRKDGSGLETLNRPHGG